LLRPSLGGLLWRSSKADVARELGLPPQHQHLSTLAFSAVEQHFYSRQHAACVQQARAALPPGVLTAALDVPAGATEPERAPEGEPGAARGGADRRRRQEEAAAAAQAFQDRPLDYAEEQRLLVPLLRLRQACCHPQARSCLPPWAHRRLLYGCAKRALAEILFGVWVAELQ
jgi:E3 ubiquitin-protein ligase SHPRH